MPPTFGPVGVLEAATRDPGQEPPVDSRTNWMTIPGTYWKLKVTTDLEDGWVKRLPLALYLLMLLT